ncbi:uncharacterized protein IL334_000840 [Kwoniella shivajii]|uniref:GDS1 winged helix domain-containing protein n=1 Tax=Kwoniella shivajii TaxID=564305 RepID=A0ABZ1CRC7_9TREE|nr:hypothetical protein IL334_000840 [Kwoniella shivajii]
MARPIRPAPAPSNPSTPISNSTTNPQRSSSNPRTSARVRPSAGTPSASTSCTPGPSTPYELGLSGKGKPACSVEAKAHGLRSVGGASERTPCPFPAQWGGRDKCGITEEDENDDVLMSILGSIASYENRALSAEEIASTCFQQGWLRPPSAAIEPTTLINNAIRSYLKRCERTSRHCLLAKHQLAGSVVEQVLQPALHPAAFEDSVRPKGTVWFLCGGSGKTKWKNPFEGIEIPKIPQRKPAPPKKIQPQPSSQTQKDNKPVKMDEKKTNSAQKGKGKIPVPVKIRLVLNGTGPPIGGDDDVSSEVGSSTRSRSVSVGQETIGLGLAQPISLPQSKPIKRSKPRRPRDLLDSSSESDTSDSEVEFDIPGPSRLIKRTTSLRKVPPPLSLNGSPRVHSSSRLPLHSPFMDVYFPSPIIPTSPFQPHTSPFPSHSLDNTTWTARHDRLHHFETSSSSSDDEMRETTWGLDSEILVKAIDGDEEDRPSWSMDEDETKVKEATDALRVLFPMSTPEEEMDLESRIKLNQLDNRSSSVFESPLNNMSSSMKGQLKAVDAGGIPLNAWIANSSPSASPKLRSYKLLAPPIDVSPTQHLSKLRSSFDPEEMEVDEEGPWLDETGELPIKAEDTFSDVDLGSNVGDAPTPEHDRHLHTALWAQEAAAIRIKQEPEDYPSPVNTDPDDQSASGYRGSRASSTPSSGSSELPPFEIEVDNGRMGVDEVILGPESISVEELDGWLPAQSKVEKTPHRGRPLKSRNNHSRCSGNWGGIGVCQAPASIVKQPARTRSIRSNATARRRRSSPLTPIINLPERLTPETDIDVEGDDAIGTADLEKARVEADAREEQHRKACKEKAEQQRAMMEAYRQTVQAEALDHPDSSPRPWTEGSNNAPWGTASTESLQLSTPGVLSPLSLFSMSNLSLGTPNEGMFAGVDPKALVSPPIQTGFGFPSMAIHQSPPQGHCVDMNMGMLDAVLSEQEVEAIMAATAPAPVPVLAPLPPASLAPPALALPSVSASTVVVPSRPITPASAPLPSTVTTPNSRKGSSNKASAAGLLPSVIKVKVQATAIPVTTSIPNEKGTAMVALPTTLPAEITPQPVMLSTPTTTTPPNEPANLSMKTTPSPTSTISSTPSMPPSTAGGNGKSGGKIATITKPLCPGVDACVVDNIPVYAHLFEGKQGQGRQVLLRRLDTDFVNANGLLLALDVPESKHAEYLDHPVSTVRLAARHVIPPTNPAAEYSQGVSGIWVHLSEAREFARRAKLKEGSLLASVLREDLFQLFATLAGLKPDHPPSETFGLPFVPRRPISTSSSSSSLSTSSANSKSTPNLSALSTSAPSHQVQAKQMAVSNPSSTTSTPKGPLVRSAPPTPPEGCPQPKRRRATISSPLAKKPGTIPIQPMTPVSTASHKHQLIAPAPGSVPASSTRMSVAAQKRATRASISGSVGRANLAK